MSLAAATRGPVDLVMLVGGSLVVAHFLNKYAASRLSGGADPSGSERSRARVVDRMFPKGDDAQRQPDPLDSRSPADVAVGSTSKPDAPNMLSQNGWLRVENSQSACRTLNSAIADFKSGVDPDDIDDDRWAAINAACARPLQCGAWTQRVHPTCRIGSDRGKVKGLGFTPSSTHASVPHRQERAINDIVRNSGVVRAGRVGDLRAAGLRVVPPNVVQPGAEAPGWQGSRETKRFAMRQI